MGPQGSAVWSGAESGSGEANRRHGSQLWGSPSSEMLSTCGRGSTSLVLVAPDVTQGRCVLMCVGRGGCGGGERGHVVSHSLPPLLFLSQL